MAEPRIYVAPLATPHQQLELNDVIARYHAATEAEAEAHARAIRMAEMRLDSIRELRGLGFSCRKIASMIGLPTAQVQKLSGKGSARRAMSARASELVHPLA